MWFKRTKQAPLHVLNVWLDPEGADVKMVCELCYGDRLVASETASGNLFGLESMDSVPWGGQWHGKGRDAVLNFLRDHLLSDSSPVWLSFGTHLAPSSADPISAGASGGDLSTAAAAVRPRVRSIVSRPSGFLSTLSWELNLVPSLNRPVLRMQGLPLRPLTQHQTLHIAICCSFSAAKQLEPPNATIDRIFKQIPEFPGQSVTLHIFADKNLQTLLAPLPERLAHVGTVRIYNPEEAAKYGDAERTRSVDNDVTDLENPWLLWMRDSLQSTGVDAIQFVTHGYLGHGRGSLAFAESPVHNEDRRWARFVGTRQLSMLLDQLGAWSALLVSPLSNYSPPGMRTLQEELTDYVAGPLALYEMADDVQNQALRSAYAYLFGASDRHVPREPSLALYTHPDWTQPFDADQDVPVRQLVEDYTLAGRLRDSFDSSKEVPTWVASGQRSLEKAVARMSLTESDSDVGRAAQEGRQDALRFAADLFAKFAAKTTEKL